tara:strand:- start:815 stop:1213 length:399 start_codon:yes stop_codon:yes gene_type:complete
LKNIIENIKLKFKKSKKSKFIFYGVLNTLLTNFLLQILLFFYPIIFSTFVSQIFNLNFGYFLYGKKVFGVKIFRKSFYFKYLLISFFLWNLNWMLISFLNSYNISRNLAALMVIPFLALISFMYQKYLIFVE